MRRTLVIVLLIALVGAVVAIPAFGAGKTKHVLVGDDLAFHPHKLKIHKGTKVIWRWGGTVVHNVTVIKGPVKFHSRDQMTGTYSHVFTKKGSYTLECTIHHFKMTVKVS